MVKEILEGRFMDHPLHPLLVHLPVGLWVASLIFDIVFLASGNASFAATSYYCVIGGLIGALLAIPPGLAEYLEIPADTVPKRLGTLHFALNVVVFALFFVNFLSRRALLSGTPNLVTAGQFVLSLISVVLLGISGYLGGLMVYEHGIGQRPQLRGKKPVESVRRVA